MSSYFCTEGIQNPKNLRLDDTELGSLGCVSGVQMESSGCPGTFVFYLAKTHNFQRDGVLKEMKS